MKNQSYVYNNGEIVVSFDPCLCIHSGKCKEKVSKIFRTSKLPWVNKDGSKTHRMIKHISKCPSKALHYDYIAKCS